MKSFRPRRLPWNGPKDLVSRPGLEPGTPCLKRLLYKARRPVSLIVDGHPTHRAAAVKRFVQTTEGRLRLFCLPAYSPELYPDELVWVTSRPMTSASGASLGQTISSPSCLGHLRGLQKDRQTVRSSFQEPHTTYAAA